MKQYKSTISEFGLKYIKSNIKKVKLSSSKDCADYIRQFYFDDLMIYESFFLVLLNRPLNTIGYVKIAQGGVTGVAVDVKIIAKYAIDSLASAVILAHNHPSGVLTPSNADKDLTNRVKSVLKLIDTTVLDHIILGENNYYSFADEGDI